MKLIPKAKAVRIRIKSGGEEHSSLDSLKKNFDLSDVRVLLDGRLSRWLKQQGEHDLASKIESSDKEKLIKDDFSLCKLFFATEIDNIFSNIHSFADYCIGDSNYRKTGINLLRNIVCDDFNVAKKIYTSYGLNCFSGKEWISVFARYEHLNDPEILFYLGRLYYESMNDSISGIKYINMAANLSLQDAIECKKKINSLGIDKGKIKKWIDDNWDSKYKRQYLKFDDIYFNDKEKNLLLFVCNSYQIAYRTFYYSANNASEYVDWQYRNVEYIPEIDLIKALLYKAMHKNQYFDILNKIQSNCKLARIESASSDYQFDRKYLLNEKIEYIVKHFLDD